MQQKEFEELTGLQVAPEEYYEIEQIYNTADTIDKKEFCEHWKRGNYMYIFAQLVKKIRDYEKWAEDNSEWVKKQQDVCIPVLLDKANVYNDYKLKEVAISLAGVRKTARLSIMYDYKLCADEKEYLLAMIAAAEMTPSIDNTED
ncbi:hypothetical protein [Leyella stercorea]|uniref:hypothetical protein n=1 Tax=Leyella stercorea TaxID=363265 RepID=UPI003522516F